MGEALQIQANSDTPAELRDLISRCMVSKPDKKALAELQRYVAGHPGLLSATMGMGVIVQAQLVSKIAQQPAVEEATIDDIHVIQRGLAYDQAPMLEKLIIQNVVNTWLRLQWVEYHLASFMGQSDVSIASIAWWEKRLSISQGRYLRALETLAKVRKLALPDLQVNIAQDGSQQLNVAGSLIAGAKRKPEGES